MEWRNLGQFPSGIILWEPVEPPEAYRDIMIHAFDGWEGYTVSFGLHQVSRFKCVEDAMKFVDAIVESQKARAEMLSQKEARKSKRSKKNADNLAHV